ncbi:MAG: DUF502 domain-containing protein [Tepidisphaerales bacterium]
MVAPDAIRLSGEPQSAAAVSQGNASGRAGARPSRGRAHVAPAAFRYSVSQTLPQKPVATPRKRVSFSEDFRRFFVRGLATLLPTLITLLLLLKVWEILWEYLGRHIIAVVRLANGYLVPENEAHRVKWFWDTHLSPWEVELIGVLLAIVVVYVVGLFVGGLLGRTAWRLVEMGVMRMPLIRGIYAAVKQVTDFILAERTGPINASSVVAVQPHACGIWSIGLVTGDGVRSLSEQTGQEMVTVFVPSSPTAVAGYVLVVPRKNVVILPMTVEEAMRLLITGGVSGEIDQLKRRLESGKNAPDGAM